MVLSRQPAGSSNISKNSFSWQWNALGSSVEMSGSTSSLEEVDQWLRGKVAGCRQGVSAPALGASNGLPVGGQAPPTEWSLCDNAER